MSVSINKLNSLVQRGKKLVELKAYTTDVVTWLTDISNDTGTKFRQEINQCMFFKHHNNIWTGYAINIIGQLEAELKHELERIPKEYDVFLSHAASDKLDYVDELHTQMETQKLNVFYDSAILTWGDDLNATLLNNIYKSRFAVIVISEGFFNREWTEFELSTFLNRQDSLGQKIVLPLLYGISVDKLKNKYSELASIICISAQDKSIDEIVDLCVKQVKTTKSIEQ